MKKAKFKPKTEIVMINIIQNLIYTIRGIQVMIDDDLARLYGVETKRLNEQVKRNFERFPAEFCFQLTLEENEYLRSQNATSKNRSLKSQNATSNTNRGGRRYQPYAFTEQGVAMLSAVLKSETAVQISIQIINTFVAMRKFIASNGSIFQRIDTLERKQLEHRLETDEKFNIIFNALEEKDHKPKQGIFFDGQVFDAYKFVSDIIRASKKSIIIIDNYVDDTVLTLLSKRKKCVKINIFTKTISKQMALDVKKYNSQYPMIEIKEFKNAHDRFIIIDNKDVYHFGASLKDLGKKWFAFSKFDIEAFTLIERLEMTQS